MAKSYSKYTAANRIKVYGHIIRLAQQGKTNAEIAEDLTALGFKHPSGVPLAEKPGIVSQVLNRYAKNKLAEFPFKAAKPTCIRLPETLVSIMTDPSLTAEQKVKMTLAYADIQ